MLLFGCRSTVTTGEIDYFRRGTEKYDREDFGGPEADFTAAIRRAPTNANAYFARGLVEEEQRKVDRALADYTRG